MPKLTSEGRVKAYFVPSIEDLDAPTDVEIAAGTPLTPQMPTSGVDITWNRNNASISMLAEGFTPEQVGTRGVSITLTFVRDPDDPDTGTDDDIWELWEYQLSGYLLISRFGEPAAPETGPPAVPGSAVEVYPIEAHDPAPLAPAENEYQQFEVEMAVTDEPSMKAVVAADTT